jgi:ribosomal protein S18 acetylase RimI-like enzyme
MQPTFRKASPADAAILSELIYDSGPDAWEYVFTTRTKHAKEFAKYALEHHGGEFGYDCHTVVEYNGKIVGIGAEYTGQNAFSFTWNGAKQILSFYPFPTSLVVMVRGLQAESIMKLPKKDVHYIGHLAIDPDYRGLGIGEKLVEFHVENARTLNRKKIELDVAETNPRAKKLYEKLGFSMIGKVRSKIRRKIGKNWIRIPDHFRLRYS